MLSTGADRPRRAVAHQRAICRLLFLVFNLDDDHFIPLTLGGGRTIDRLIRSYHYWAEEYEDPRKRHPDGICPYDNPRLGYFRMSIAAAAVLRQPGTHVHPEHVVPVAVLQRLLEALRRANGGVSLRQVTKVMRANEIVFLTEDERRTLDSKPKLKSDMPQTWSLGDSHLARLEQGLGMCELRGDRLIGPW